MSKEKQQLTRLPAQGSYDVGYGKRPTETRFRPGQSGNPRGRPKGWKNQRATLSTERLKDIILEEAYRTIKVNDGDRQVSVPMAQAIVRSLAVGAAKGNTRAERLFAELLATTETSNHQKNDQWLETAINYKIEWEIELERRRRHGISLPDPIPHPDDIQVDFRRNTVEIRGPMSKEEVKEIEHFLCRQAEFREELDWLQKQPKSRKNTISKNVLETEIAADKRILEIIAAIIAQRASPKAIKRLVDSSQIIIDPVHRDPDVEDRINRRRQARQSTFR